MQNTLKNTFEREIIEKWKSLNVDFRKKYGPFKSRYSGGTKISIAVMYKMLYEIGFRDNWNKIIQK